jgi:HSP20 family protein
MHPMDRLRRDFETLFGPLWRDFGMEEDFGNMRVWDFDITENENEVTVRAEVPGFEPNELDVQVHNEVLTIKAEKQHKEGQREEFRSFSRSVMLPSGVDQDKAQATYRNGVLELHLPRSEGAQPRRINVQGGQGMGEQAGTQRAQPQTEPTKGSASAKK